MEKKIKEFLIYARQNTYASGEKAKIVDGFDVYIVKDGDLKYRDAYIGRDRFFQGQETIFEKNKPIWSMSYRGAAEKGVDTKKVFGFLQSILRKNSDKVRLPGDKEIFNNNWKYNDRCEGNIDEFKGIEKIYLDEKLVHWMNYFGGIIE